MAKARGVGAAERAFAGEPGPQRPTGTILLKTERPGTVRPECVARALVVTDPRSQALIVRVRKLAPSDASILIVGETGTGKELVARHIHDLSVRRDRPFVAMNGSALADSLVDAELFGYEKGAFTGAVEAKAGWFEAAHGGTLFLDEIGDLPLSTQVKLLRVLQEREVVRVGSRSPRPVDVRVLAATHVDLRAAVEAGRFREDLYYRIRVAEIVLPPLRERPSDILPLARHFVEVYAHRLKLADVALSVAAEARLLEHAWPGNIRELENAVHHALLDCRGETIRPEHLHLSGRNGGQNEDDRNGLVAPLKEALLGLFDRDVPDLHAMVTETMVLTAFEACGRNQVQAAQLLGISRNILRTHLARLGLIAGRRRPAGGKDKGAGAARGSAGEIAPDHGTRRPAAASG
jgi:sigma-54 dependent transcriptional regulator